MMCPERSAAYEINYSFIFCFHDSELKYRSPLEQLGCLEDVPWEDCWRMVVVEHILCPLLRGALCRKGILQGRRIGPGDISTLTIGP